MSEATAEALGVEKHRCVKYLLSECVTSAGSFIILPFALEHDVPNLGFMVKIGEYKVLYITDTYYCRYTFSGLTHILVEANHSYAILDEKVERGELSPARKNRLIQSHFALENVIKFLKSMCLTTV